MSVASPFPCIKLAPSPSTPSSPSTSSSSSSSSSSACCSSFKFSPAKCSVVIRSSMAEGPLRRPVAPPVRQPTPPSPAPAPAPAPPKAPVPRAAPVAAESPVVTLEFQRKMAKELQDYFKQKKVEDANQGPFFGFIGKNEIANGRLPIGMSQDTLAHGSCMGVPQYAGIHRSIPMHNTRVEVACATQDASIHKFRCITCKSRLHGRLL